jgi:hypothetical protein
MGALLALARNKPWWETVDGLAGVIGKLVRAPESRRTRGHGRGPA